MKNKVYVLMHHVPYEGSDVLGVYSERSLAETDKGKALKSDDSDGFNDIFIVEHTLDE